MSKSDQTMQGKCSLWQMKMKCSVVFFVCSMTVAFATLFEGDPCELPYHEPGQCVRLSQCPIAIRLVRSRQHPKTCSYIRSVPIVCCPISAGPLYARLSERKCQSYKMHQETMTLPPPMLHTSSLSSRSSFLNKSLSMEEVQPLNETRSELFVVGGTLSLAREFPHMAALGFTSENKKVWLCGGTLISERFVLTAAHCLSAKEYGDLQWVRLGDLDLYSSADDASPEDYRISRRIPHPRYKLPSAYHDIALLELPRSVKMSSYVRPACLPTETEATISSLIPLIATGWGLTAFAGRQSDFLQKVDLELFSELECERTYQDMANSRKLKDGIKHEMMFCAGSRSEEKDTCQGDSGGPLQIQDGDTFTVIGITSFEKSCGIVNLPGVYTRVAPYVPWIETIVWPDEY